MNKIAIENQRICDLFVQREVICCVSSWVEDSFKKELINIDEVENQFEKEEQEEVFEWWLVSEFLFENLRERKEVVIDSNYGKIWGRCTTGQSIFIDNIIETICKKQEILVGQKYAWEDKNRL